MSKQIDKIIKSLDIAVGMLLVMSTKDAKVRTAMEIVSRASFLLGEEMEKNNV